MSIDAAPPVHRYGLGLRHPDAFLLWIARGVLAEYDLNGCQISDLLQEGRIGLWRGDRSWLRKGETIPAPGYVTYLMVSAWRRMTAYLRHVRRQLRVPPGCPRPKRSSLLGESSDDGGMEAAESGLFVEEQLGLVEAVLIDHWGPEQGARDFAVFEAWLRRESRTLADVVGTCDWLADDRAAQDVLERVILVLREYFGGNTHAPILLSSGGNRGASTGSRKDREEQRRYQADYYARHRDELRRRSRERMRVRRAADEARRAAEQASGGAT